MPSKRRSGKRLVAITYIHPTTNAELSYELDKDGRLHLDRSGRRRHPPLVLDRVDLDAHASLLFPFTPIPPQPPVRPEPENEAEQFHALFDQVAEPPQQGIDGFLSIMRSRNDFESMYRPTHPIGFTHPDCLNVPF
jgi:hypothetical protein